MRRAADCHFTRQSRDFSHPRTLRRTVRFVYVVSRGGHRFSDAAEDDFCERDLWRGLRPVSDWLDRP